MNRAHQGSTWPLTRISGLKNRRALPVVKRMPSTTFRSLSSQWLSRLIREFLD